MFIKNQDYIAAVLKDAASDIWVGVTKEYAPKNKALDRPFTDDQLKFIVDLTCSIAAEMVLWYNDAGVCAEEDPSFAARVTSAEKAGDHCHPSSTGGTAPVKQRFLRLVRHSAQNEPKGDHPDRD